MGRNDIGFVIAGGLHFDQHLVRQADDGRTGLADKAFTDTDFIGTIGFGNADALVLDDHEVIALLGLDRDNIGSMVARQGNFFIDLAVDLDDRIRPAHRRIVTGQVKDAFRDER